MLNTVICIDDDPVTLMICEMVLAKVTLAEKILTFENAQEGLSFLKEGSNLESTSLILLDLNMPVMDGWEFLNEYSSMNISSLSKPKVAILSSSVNPSDVNRSKEYKCVFEFIKKPMSIEVAEKLRLHFQ